MVFGRDGDVCKFKNRPVSVQAEHGMVRWDFGGTSTLEYRDIMANLHNQVIVSSSYYENNSVTWHRWYGAFDLLHRSMASGDENHCHLNDRLTTAS